ncbi:MAG: resolvase [Elainellaceae cyanobacterium]
MTTILGIDPGRDKCGVAVAKLLSLPPKREPGGLPVVTGPEAELAVAAKDAPEASQVRPVGGPGGMSVLHHSVVAAEATLDAIAALLRQFEVTQLVLGNQTTAQGWQTRLEERFSQLPVTLVDERNSTLEARDRYWQMHPASGLARWIPQPLRSIPGPVDGIVAVILIERYLKQMAR